MVHVVADPVVDWVEGTFENVVLLAEDPLLDVGEGSLAHWWEENVALAGLAGFGTDAHSEIAVVPRFWELGRNAHLEPAISAHLAWVLAGFERNLQ